MDMRRYFRVHFLYIKYDWNNMADEDDIDEEAVPCTPDRFPLTPHQKKQFNTLETRYHCRPDILAEHQISGSLSSHKGKASGFRIFSCREKAENPDVECESEKVIEEMTKKVSITFIYKEFFFD